MGPVTKGSLFFSAAELAISSFYNILVDGAKKKKSNLIPVSTAIFFFFCTGELRLIFSYFSIIANVLFHKAVNGNLSLISASNFVKQTRFIYFTLTGSK